MTTLMKIIGNLKIDEARPERVHYFFATLISYGDRYISHSGIGITLHQASPELVGKTMNLLKKHFDKWSLVDTTSMWMHRGEGGGRLYSTSISMFDIDTYWKAIKIHDPDPKGYYTTFEEDHFCMLQNEPDMERIINVATPKNVDIIRASFHEIERNSCANIPGSYEYGMKVFRMNEQNHSIFCQPYGFRFFIGTNNIIKTSFAERLYSREGKRPHDFEIAKYDPNFEYTCGVSSLKIMQCIDDDHGEVGTSLLSSPTEKFNKCMEEAKECLYATTDTEMPSQAASKSAISSCETAEQLIDQCYKIIRSGAKNHTQDECMKIAVKMALFTAEQALSVAPDNVFRMGRHQRSDKEHWVWIKQNIQNTKIA